MIEEVRAQRKLYNKRGEEDIEMVHRSEWRIIYI